MQKSDCFDDIPASVWQQDWVVHCQPVGSGLPALKYLAPYIFRVAISNNRILKLQDDQVTFLYRDPDTGRSKLCTLAAEEFIRRFLQHVLPKGFVKVRYYGFFSPGQRPRLAALRQLLADSPPEQAAPPEGLGPARPATEQAASDLPASAVVYCPSCGQVMQRRCLPRAKGGLPP